MQDLNNPPHANTRNKLAYVKCGGVRGDDWIRPSPRTAKPPADHCRLPPLRDGSVRYHPFEGAQRYTRRSVSPISVERSLSDRRSVTRNASTPC